MYDRAARNFTFQSSVGTPFKIGPGSYEHHSTINIKSDAYAPFQSLASRDFILTHDDMLSIPGPAQYNSKLLKNKIPGGSSISNTDVRFKPFKSDVPGPGQYCIEDPIKCHSADNKKQRAADKFKVSYKRMEMAPSIPHAKTAFGYEEGPYGALLKQPAPDRDLSLGPAFYVPKTGETATTQKYRGCFWSYDRAPRTNFGGSKGPGPGQYEPFSDHWAELAEPMQVREGGGGKQPAQLQIPRFFDELQKQAIKAHVPGPASYVHSGKINCPRALFTDDGNRIEQPPFGVQDQRFRSRLNTVPGPGTYTDPRTALHALKRITGMKASPFGATAVRFSDRVDFNIPGPQVYNVSEDPSKVRPSYISLSRKGGFGSTSIRDVDLGNKNAQDVPGPSHYQPKPGSDASRVQPPMSSMFASLTNRDFDPVSRAKADQPDASLYDVVTSFSRTQGKKVYSEPRTKEARQRHCSFMSNASRYAKGSPLDCGDPSLPGPGAYEAGTFLNTRTGKFHFREKRFREQVEETPGPGQYEFSERVAHTVIKPTFNSTLGNRASKQASGAAAVLEGINPPTRQTVVAAM